MTDTNLVVGKPPSKKQIADVYASLKKLTADIQKDQTEFLAFILVKTPGEFKCTRVMGLKVTPFELMAALTTVQQNLTDLQRESLEAISHAASKLSHSKPADNIGYR
jgi:hypothetical protein